jgi:hypothetical protein
MARQIAASEWPLSRSADAKNGHVGFRERKDDPILAPPTSLEKCISYRAPQARGFISERKCFRIIGDAKYGSPECLSPCERPAR